MDNFLFIYRQNPDSHSQMTPDQFQQQMQNWHVWLREGIEQGWMVNIGDGLKKEGKLVNSKKAITDGPFAETKEILGGYSIVTAESLDAAAEFAKGCPCLSTGGSVEVRPLAGFKFD